MSDIRKRMMFLMQFEAGKDIRVLKEEVENLAESKQTDMQALSLFKKSGTPELTGIKALEKLAAIDNTKNKSLSVPFAKAVIEMGVGRINDILKTFSIVSTLVNDMRITLPMASDAGYIVNNKTFRSYSQFSDFITETSKLAGGYKEWEKQLNVTSGQERLYPRPGHPEDEQTQIEIYDGNEPGRCIKYGMGGLTGKFYSFCISKPANTQWQGYRDDKTSTFYFVFDKKRSFDDPLHITVVDHTATGWEVTDYNNTTKNIAEYGNDMEAYIQQLRDRGVPVDEILVHQPKTKEEITVGEKLGKKNPSLEWFKQLNFTEKTRYIGRGHLLSDEQFQYLWDHRKNPGAFHLIHQYVDIGQAIPENQFKILVGGDDPQNVPVEKAV